jgi:hypothetical protein
MKPLAAGLAVAATLFLPAAQAKEARVVGLIWDGPNSRLAWLDPATLQVSPGAQTPLGGHTGSWAFSLDHGKLAIVNPQKAELRFVDTRTMRVIADIDLGPGSSAGNVTWIRSNRLLATLRTSDRSTLVVVDPQQGTIVRRVELPRPAVSGRSLPNGLALLLGSEGRFAPAVIAVVDAEGSFRTITAGRVSIGSVHRPRNEFEQRQPGFAVDRAGGRAVLVGADFTVAEIALRTSAVAYHSPSERTLLKSIRGFSRGAMWLRNGMLAVSGWNYRGLTPAQSLGLRLIDTRTWRTRVVDREARIILLGDGVLLAGRPNGLLEKYSAYSFDGTLRYRMAMESGLWLQTPSPPARYAYICRNNELMRIFDTRTGATTRAFSRERLPTCARPLYGPNAGY